MLNHDFDTLKQSIEIYDDMYWEFAKPDPKPNLMGIRVNPKNGKKKYGRKEIRDDIFEFLAETMQLIEVDPSRNVSLGGEYYVIYSLRKEIQIEARKRNIRERGRDNSPKTMTRSMKIDDTVRKYSFNKNFNHAAE